MLDVYHPVIMSEWGVGNIISISKLAAKVYATYQDAPDNYKHISVSEGVMSLQSMIDTTAQHFESTPFSDNDLQECQEVLKGCENVLKGLNSFFKKKNGPASTHTSQVHKRVQPGAEDITTLKARLMSSTILLNSFIQRFEFIL